MPLSLEEQRLRDQFFKTLTEAVLSLQPGSDPEVTLEALIEAAQMLQDRLQRELAELRQEQAD
jgi:acyl-CoA reductase-like NAD-dependent aldehyde dehydrogenase